MRKFLKILLIILVLLILGYFIKAFISNEKVLNQPVLNVERPTTRQKQPSLPSPSPLKSPEATQIPPKEVTISDQIEAYMAQMTIEEKIGQLFMIAIRQDAQGVPITEVTEEVRTLLKDYPIGGIILFKENIETTKQVQQLTRELQASSKIPLFIGVDEEGGSVSRVGNNPKINNVPFQTAFDIGMTGDTQLAYNEALRMGVLLKGLGFNMDFAPVADIYNEPRNTVIGKRSFGKTAEEVTPMVIHFAQGLMKEGILPVIKHFPGHGNTLEDSHDGLAYLNKTLSELESEEIVPFEKALEAGVGALMRGHLVVKGVEEGIPASLSTSWGKYLLGHYNCDNVLLMTDAMDMGAIRNQYTVEEAVRLCIAAENDICLMPADIERAYNALLQSYKEGKLTEERINRSVRKILSKKVALNALVLE